MTVQSAAQTDRAREVKVLITAAADYRSGPTALGWLRPGH